MWQAIVFPALIGSSLALGAIQAMRHRRRLRWARAARSCGLQVEEKSLSAGGGSELKVQTGQFEVRIEASRHQKHGVRIAVAIPAPPDFSSVKICGEVDRPLWGREIEVGDEPFDRAFFVAGPAQLLRALLNAQVRHLMARAHAKSRIEIAQGEVRAEMSDKQIRSLLPLLLKLGRRLAKPLDVPRRLAENAVLDPEAGVRLQNLLLLIREFPEHPRTAVALRKALADSSPMVRIRAAKELGAEGREVLLAIAQSLGDDALSAQAVSILGGGLPFGQARDLLGLALEKRRLQTACACVERLGHSRDAGDVNVLAKVMTGEKDEIAAAAALALGTTGNVDAVPPLLLALESGRRDLWVAAATALGRVGTADAVLPLKEAAERSALHLELRRAARQAIAEIQSRLSSASPGQLSLTATEAGQLSLAQAEAGQLSLPTLPGS